MHGKENADGTSLEAREPHSPGNGDEHRDVGEVKREVLRVIRHRREAEQTAVERERQEQERRGVAVVLRREVPGQTPRERVLRERALEEVAGIVPVDEWVAERVRVRDHGEHERHERPPPLPGPYVVHQA